MKGESDAETTISDLSDASTAPPMARYRKFMSLPRQPHVQSEAIPRTHDGINILNSYAQSDSQNDNSFKTFNSTALKRHNTERFTSSRNRNGCAVLDGVTLTPTMEDPAVTNLTSDDLATPSSNTHRYNIENLQLSASKPPAHPIPHFNLTSSTDQLGNGIEELPSEFIRLKCHLGEEDVRMMMISLNPPTPFLQVKARIEAKFHRPNLRIKFRDDEDELVTVGDQEDFDLACSLCPSRLCLFLCE